MNENRTLKVGDVIYVPSEVIGLYSKDFPGGFSQERVVHAPVGSCDSDGQYIAPRDRVLRITMTEFAALEKLERLKEARAEKVAPAHSSLSGDSPLSLDDELELTKAPKSPQEAKESVLCASFPGLRTQPRIVEVSQDEEDYLKANGKFSLLCDGVIREFLPIGEQTVFFIIRDDFSDKGRSIGRFRTIALAKDGSWGAYVRDNG